MDILNHDPETLVGTYLTVSNWMLGCPDRAVRLGGESATHARRRTHPFDLGWALYPGAEVFKYRCEPERVRLRAEECERLGRDDNMPVGWALWAPLRHGLALIRAGRAAKASRP